MKTFRQFLEADPLKFEDKPVMADTELEKAIDRVMLEKIGLTPYKAFARYSVDKGVNRFSSVYVNEDLGGYEYGKATLLAITVRAQNPRQRKKWDGDPKLLTAWRIIDPKVDIKHKEFVFPEKTFTGQNQYVEYGDVENMRSEEVGTRMGNHLASVVISAVKNWPSTYIGMYPKAGKDLQMKAIEEDIRSYRRIMNPHPDIVHKYGHLIDLEDLGVV